VRVAQTFRYRNMSECQSIVEYFSDHEGGKCGYCKQQNKSLSRGMWAHRLLVEDYELLLNRGWRRSGKYCYKPTMKETCCPQYEIKCDVNQIKLSKSQKKVIRRMKNFLLSEESKSPKKNPNISEQKKPSDLENTSIPSPSPKSYKKGDGADPNLPTCIKAKVRRLQKKKKNLSEKSLVPAKPTNSVNNIQPNLEEQLPHLSDSINFKRKLKVKLVSSEPTSQEFEDTKQQSYELYLKYQTKIHQDKETECTQLQWQRFLVGSPLVKRDDRIGLSFGSFHNQYWLDDKLIAVGVIDILPTLVSSVYVYYDPDYSFLSLGVYTAISEIALTKSLQKLKKDFQFYCMGYYIETCPKMKYKGLYNPSYLLCPETYQWVNLEKCRETLKVSPYARLNVLDGGSPDYIDEDSIKEPFDKRCLDNILILHKRTIFYYFTYKMRKRAHRKKRRRRD